MRNIFVLSVMPLAIAACSTTRSNVLESGITLATDTVLPAPTRPDLVAPERESLIGAADSIQIEVFGVDELTREVLVDAGGAISIPLVGEVQAAGLTSRELARLIGDRLRGRYVRNPDVTVNLKTANSEFVTVEGAVNQPGLYPVTNQTTLLRAVAAARGVTNDARLEDVVVLRTVGNQRMAGLYSLRSIRAGYYADPQIYANDQIVVGNSPSRELFRNALAISPLLITPLIAILQ